MVRAVVMVAMMAAGCVGSVEPYCATQAELGQCDGLDPERAEMCASSDVTVALCSTMTGSVDGVDAQWRVTCSDDRMLSCTPDVYGDHCSFADWTQPCDEGQVARCVLVPCDGQTHRAGDL